MYGAIFGDIIGSRFEFDRGGKTKSFELFTKEDNWTDDTAMSVAVADGLLKAGKDASVEVIKEEVIKSMRYWGKKYPNAGYGGRFYQWLFFSKNPKPYGSYGNGSAMRVSAAGWLYDSLERTLEVARATAEVTHNHPEGIKGAECTAAVMFLSRMGKSKEEILKYVVDMFGYDLSESLDQMRERHEHIESCQDSLPKALKSFFEGDSYEDVVRNAVSLGGDTDTLGAIAGAMAEAFYGLPVGIIAKGITYLPEDMKDVIKRFDKAIGRVSEDTMNEGIKEAVRAIHETMSDQAFYDLMEVLVNRMLEDGEVMAPMVDVNNVMDTLDLESLKKGETFSFDREVRLQLDLVMNNEGQKWIPLFTSEEERHRQPTANVALNVPIERILLNGLKGEDVEGVVINPFGESLMMPKELIRITMDEYERTKNKVSLN